MVFAHRPPAVLRFAAYSAVVVDLSIGVALLVMGLQTPGPYGLEIGGLVLVFTCWIPAWVLLGVRYRIEGGELIVRRGPVARRIALSAVEEVRISAPVPGLDGVILRHRRRGRLASEALYPEDASAFLRGLQAGASHLEVAGEGTLRRAR